MDLNYTDDEKAFRERARAWLAENRPREPRPTEPQRAGAFDRAWQRKLFEGGYAGLNWPKEYGGAGYSLIEQLIWFEEVARVHAPSLNALAITINHAGPTLIARGTEAQKAFHLPRMLCGESIWCQGFSEPGAGSDLAALKTSGEISGDEIIVNGQKMWTSYGHLADYQELLIRTEPGSKRHHGLSWVICDMKAPGIEVVPVTNMMGELHVNMVFYDNVRIPLANVVGGVGEGWSVAMSTLSIERSLSFLTDQVELLQRVDDAFRLADRVKLEDGSAARDDAGLMRRLAAVKADAFAVRAMTIANISRIAEGGSPGAEGSLLKLYATETCQRLAEIVRDMLGHEFLRYGSDRHSNHWTYEFMWAWVLTISGGSSEIQREIIADRLLGLPRSR
ncbi:acyl-CoA dehydrogenase [Sphingomonas sp. Root710]|nr:acyl-CoA dehydrogenase [Sphingomonas sp. Root710]